MVVFGVVAITAMSQTAAHAQVDTGAISGTVKDSSGAVVSGAKLTLRNEGTNFPTSTTTDSDGTYIFTPVKIGAYTVTAEYQGFQKIDHPHIVVNVQQQVVVDFELVPGEVTQDIHVTAPPSVLQTQDASVGEVIGSDQINSLPLNGRNYFFLAQLTPGVTFSQQDARGEASNGRFAANGVPPTQNNYLLDGVDNNTNINTVQNGRDFVLPTPIDALAEFKVQTNDYSAEFGRGAGAVINATTKSGTNSFHGDVWEFLRNDALDANDYFLDAADKPRSQFQRNQFGFTAGAPVYLPHIYNGKNKTFIFAAYEGTRIHQGALFSTTVPTLAERDSGFTDFSDLISGQSGSQSDILGRSFSLGTIFDPATTRTVTAGQVDPVTGLVAENSGYVRDPFPENIIPSDRLDTNATKLLQLLPEPNAPGIFNNYISTPMFQESINQFDIRADQIIGDHDQVFFRYSYAHDDRVRPGPFPGIADGSNPLNDASLLDHSLGGALSETHTFSSSLINEARFGVSRERALFIQPYANTLGIPEQFGIQGVPQEPDNGGLPMISVGTLTTFGSPYYVPSDKYSTTYQYTDNLTKVLGAHTLRTGVEFQHILAPFTQPPFSRGFMSYSGAYTSVVNETDGTTGVAQFLLTPTTATVPNGVDNVGGMSQVYFSGFKPNDMSRNYFGAYFQDDWKVSHKLTLNLGLRWDYFGQLFERRGEEANFEPGTPFDGATFRVPQGTADTVPTAFVSALEADGISFVTTRSKVLGVSQKANFAPRLGLAYQLLPKLVLRAGYGLFYGGYEEVGYGSSLVENFPFQYYLNFVSPNAVSPITPNNSIGNLETTFSNISLNPATAPIAGISLEGNQYHWLTPYTQDFNLTLQYQLGSSTSATLAYVGSQGRHLITLLGTNNVTELLPPDTTPQSYVPFPDFARGSTYIATIGSSEYNSLQASIEKRLGNGLNFLANYTWGKVLTDVRDPAEDDIGGYRAPGVPGFGIKPDYALADFDVRQIFHFSGGYELPFGSGKRFLTDSHGVVRQLVNGWSINWILTLQDGQPFTIPCTITTGAGTGCNAVLVPGQNPIAGPHDVNQWLNPEAFANPPVVTAIGQTDFAPLGGVPTQVVGPGFHRLDFSTFKQFQTSETTHFEFRAEFFNLTNTPDFATPSFTNFLDTNTFGKITATRDAPNDAREVQFGLKFYW
jgi:hypothetical protein